MTAAIENELYAYIDKLTVAQKKSLLGFMKTLFPNASKEVGDIETYNKELEDADAQIVSGDYKSHDEVLKLSKSIIGGRK